jgi:hypothetical protein
MEDAALWRRPRDLHWNGVKHIDKSHFVSCASAEANAVERLAKRPWNMKNVWSSERAPLGAFGYGGSHPRALRPAG